MAIFVTEGSHKSKGSLQLRYFLVGLVLGVIILAFGALLAAEDSCTISLIPVGGLGGGDICNWNYPPTIPDGVIAAGVLVLVGSLVGMRLSTSKKRNPQVDRRIESPRLRSRTLPTWISVK